MNDLIKLGLHFLEDFYFDTYEITLNLAYLGSTDMNDLVKLDLYF